MLSLSLQRWRTERRLDLEEVDGQCATSLAVAPPNPRLSEENLRGYILLLSAHFQGFCRDLYTESAQIVGTSMPPALQLMVQAQFTAQDRNGDGGPERGRNEGTGTGTERMLTVL